jgi:hypothetical protein
VIDREMAFVLGLLALLVVLLSGLLLFGGVW